jgi:hypothetical protein
MNSCDHVFKNECKKIELKPFQSLLNYYGAQYWVYSMLYIEFGKL